MNDGAAGTLCASGYPDKLTHQDVISGLYPIAERECDGMEKEYIVRRLTELECTRLQGYPDGWVDIGEWTDSKGKKHKDTSSAKYKALGNSIALPWWYKLLGHITDELHETDDWMGEDTTYTLGSLFSGIGGFEYCWAMHNGKDACLWESEIEEFPMAVTRQHFGDEDLGIEGDFETFINKERNNG